MVHGEQHRAGLSSVAGGFPQSFCDYCTAPFFWQRPMLAILLHPASLLGFLAFRVAYALLSSLLVVLAAQILVDRGASKVVAYLTAIAIAFVPYFVVWGVIDMYDSGMTVLLALGIWLRGRGRQGWAAVALAASAWAKEVAAVPLLAIIVMEIVAWIRQGGWARHEAPPRRVWPYVMALAAAPIPLLYSMSIGATFPGWGWGGNAVVVWDRAFFLLWFLPIILLGLRLPRARELCLMSLSVGGFLVAYQTILGKAVEAWYYVAPSLLSMLATGLVINEWLSRTKSSPRHASRAIAASLAVVAAVVIVVITIHW